MTESTRVLPHRPARAAAADEALPIETLTYRRLFWIFFIGCFAGVVVETLWCFVSRGYFESRRGLVWGPFNVVYGLGAVLMTVGLRRMRSRHWGWTFAGCFVIGTVFEYLCSVFQEAVFGTVSWNYGDFALAQFFGGRVNPVFSCFWGGLGVLWVKLLYPWLCDMIDRIPGRFSRPLTVALTLFMVCNMAVSFAAVGRQAERRENIPPTTSFEQYLDERYPDEVLNQIYANMIIVDE